MVGVSTRIVHLWADTGVEDEVLHTFGEVVRVGIDPETNPFSTVIQADARDPPLAEGSRSTQPSLAEAAAGGGQA